MEAFITGSHAYGAPRDDSDVDLVVYMEEEDFDTLSKLLGEHKVVKDPDAHTYPSFDKDTSVSLRLGPLNLIATSDYGTYEAWKQGTEEQQGPSAPAVANPRRSAPGRGVGEIRSVGHGAPVVGQGRCERGMPSPGRRSPS